MSSHPRQQVDVVLDADFLAGPFCRVGTLFHAAAHGRATFSFAYDKAWVARPGAFEIDPDLQLHSGESYLELAEFIAIRGSAAHRAADLRQLWTRVVFNILVSNTDDHLRNHGFILEADGWRLAPAYDLNPDVEKRFHTLTIDTQDNSPDVGLALATAEFYDLSMAEARQILATVQTVVGTWRTGAGHLRLTREEIEQLAPAFGT